MSETLEHRIDSISEMLSEMSERTHYPDEWSLINDMHLTVCELKGQLTELRQKEERNKKLEKKR